MSAQLEDVIADIGSKHGNLLELQKFIKESATASSSALSAPNVLMKPTTTGNATAKAKKDRDPLAEELRTVNEFFEGNLQRCKLIRDQMDEAKDAMIKVLEHKSKAMDIIKKHQIMSKKKKSS